MRLPGRSDTVQLKTGATAMVAILSRGFAQSNEEDQVVVSQTAANTMLTHTAVHTEHVRLPYHDVPPGGHVRFISPANGKLVGEHLVHLSAECPFAGHGAAITSLGHYVVGVVHEREDGTEVDASISLRGVVGAPDNGFEGARVDELRWCVLVADGVMEQGTHDTPGWRSAVEGAARVLWVELSLVSTPAGARHTVRVDASDSHRAADGTTVRRRLQYPPVAAVVARHVPSRARGVENLDPETGLPAVGAIIRPHEYLCGIVLSQGNRFANLSRVLQAPDKAEAWVVVDVRRSGLDEVTITLEADARPFRTGDKLALRHGQKGVGVVVPSEKLAFFPELGGVVPDISIHPCALPDGAPSPCCSSGMSECSAHELPRQDGGHRGAVRTH